MAYNFIQARIHRLHYAEERSIIKPVVKYDNIFIESCALPDMTGEVCNGDIEKETKNMRGRETEMANRPLIIKLSYIISNLIMKCSSITFHLNLCTLIHVYNVFMYIFVLHLLNVSLLFIIYYFYFGFSAF